jgi:glycerol-3-phosphate dehydrogenase
LEISDFAGKDDEDMKPQAFSHITRLENLKKFEQEKFDLFIIGGGINGAGIARDASMRGMKVALVEANDFASGTSSRSSKLIHGGIRYLENFEFHLVFEALSERQKLFAMAPHLVHPLRFMLPLYKGGRVGMVKMGLGMWLYDALSLFQAPELHERLSEKESLERMPFLQKDELLGSYVYSDAYMDDDRLVHETLRSANAHGAIIANYVKATGVEMHKDKVSAVALRDQLTGKTFTAKARHFVSTVGPWTDEVGSHFFKNWKKRLRPTKGVHLTFAKERIPLSSAVVMAAEERIVFGIPRHEMVIVGTTDTDYSGPPENVRTNREDVEYLLGVVDKYFPGAKIREKDIVASYEGVRPLVADEASTEGKTSREHVIFTEPHGITFVVGGKYTTYRLISQQAVEHCLSFFPIEDKVRYVRCQTEQPINPLITEETFSELDSVFEFLRKNTGLQEEQIRWLAERHGPEAIKIVNRYGARLTYSEYEARHAIDSTMCLNLLDFFQRRVPFVLAHKDHGVSEIPRISAVFQTQLRLSTEELNEQVKKFLEHLSTEFAWRKQS